MARARLRALFRGVHHGQPGRPGGGVRGPVPDPGLHPGPAPGSCAIDWNGDPATPIAPPVYGADIARIRAAGGDVIPSFGGYSADHGGTEIADSCPSVPKIAAAYEKVITTYHVSRLDLDTEDNSLSDTAGIDRRNRAIRLVEEWAARIAVVNIMTFDYYDNQPHEMAADSITAAGHLHATLHQLYPGRSSRQVWAMIGVTEMIGIDDFGPPEIFTTADAHTIERWAAGRHLAELSFWALQRDNGGCPGTAGRDTCSGITQSTWQFSHAFEPFTSR
jgi:hypothetical protein